MNTCQIVHISSLYSMTGQWLLNDLQWTGMWGVGSIVRPVTGYTDWLAWSHSHRLDSKM